MNRLSALALATAGLLGVAMPCAAGGPGTGGGGPSEWIGRVVPPYPDGLKSNTGTCVGPMGAASTPETVCARNIGTIDSADDRTLKFYAGEFAGRSGNEARWRITDVVSYPKLRRGEYMSVATCQRDGVQDAGLIAIVDTAVDNASEQETFQAVRWAMRLDRHTGKFVTVPATSVRCANEGYGED